MRRTNSRRSSRLAPNLAAALLLASSHLALSSGPAALAAAATKKPSDEPTVTASPDEHVTYDRAVVATLKIGVKVRSKGGVTYDIHAQMPTPLECPEQQVEQTADDVTSQVTRADFRMLNIDGARQLLVDVPQLAAEDEARALMTFEIHTSEVLPPKNPKPLHIPTKLDRAIKMYVMPSPYIEVGHRKIKEAVAEALTGLEKGTAAAPEVELTAATEKGKKAPPPKKPLRMSDAAMKKLAANHTDWERIEALYDYALKHVKYVVGDDKSAVKALDDGEGDCQAVSALFVAMCRTMKIPARSVRADAHLYAEFYLLDSAEEGHWYPIESAGTRSFGGMPIPRVIFQKGDNFIVPERRRERLRYANEYFAAKPTVGNPVVTFVNARQ